jgi:hypothetical protein
VVSPAPRTLRGSLRLCHLSDVVVRPLNFFVRRAMPLTLSRSLSLAVLAIAYLRAWHIHPGLWYVTLTAVPLLLLIWFSTEIDEFTFGNWYYGYRIDPHTPPTFIAWFGWIFLLLFTALLFYPQHIMKAVGA